MIPDGLVKSEEARTAAGYGKDRWRSFLATGQLPSARIGRSLYVRADDVCALIEAQFTAA
ncbi:hypothetical protein nbrc107696_18980 [Gordonia spumicola]|uniref:DNA-binding protein n=1 Tax=Gordonia spumicola TaxID=589161 RepID=A0A7I9V8A3_9ACTN|nr:helix-turn-helix domain-containing protein [Gordonia spumicola]GEE01452.1 hypothetical protein nbrc107696_18980 [Gordonia spumicola]